MAKHSARNELARNRVTFRELTLPSQTSAGFVLRILNRNIVPHRITTVVRQPGHEAIAVETVIPKLVHHPEARRLEERYYGAAPADTDSLESVMDQLGVLSNNNSVATAALQHLQTELSIE